MANIIIEGGKPLKGEITPIGNKNSILKLIPATILCEDKVKISNVPSSSSVNTLIEIYRSLGGKITWVNKNTIELDSRQINKYKIDDNLAAQERSSFLFLGPLLARFGKAYIKEGGGCKLGNRPLDAMFKGLEKLGIEIDNRDGYHLKTKKHGIKGNFIWMLEASVTGTENIILSTVVSKGTTIIYNAACEPHTQDLCNFLNSVGAKIDGIGTNRLIIEGVEKLSGGEWSVISDHIDIGGLIVAGAITNGHLIIKNAIPNHMTQIINNYEKFNVKIEIENNSIIVKPNTLISKRNIKGDIDKIYDQPWPGFPVDLIPQAVILAANSENQMRIYSNMYEVQLIELYTELFKMNANLMMVNPNLILSLGKSNLKGTKLNSTSVLQSTHALVLAGLVAKGKTIIQNADIIFRRFPDLIQSYQKLGASIWQE